MDNESDQQKQQKKEKKLNEYASTDTCHTPDYND
jgi:hypothetical protein